MTAYSYITVLSNWITGYDRYQRLYTKAHIPQSTYPHEFYLLKNNELEIGETKAQALLKKTNITGNRIVRIEAELNDAEVSKNTRNGLGWIYKDHKIPVTCTYLHDGEKWVEHTVEDVTAQAFTLHGDTLKEYKDLTPLTLSFLPIAIACQASCLFCFSGSSISIERKRRIKDFTDLSYWCERAHNSGAQRFVLTGGGEPTIMPFNEIIECLEIADKHFKKKILITNGLFLSQKEEQEIEERLKALKTAGLTILSFSYHNVTPEGVKKIMGIDTNIEKVLKVWQKMDKNEVPTIRLICVLQQGAIDSIEKITEYLEFAAHYDVTQVCFKELYVSSTTESLYSGGKENIYSRDHQVSLSILLKWFADKKAPKIGELAWGAPIHSVTINGTEISVAAYTEPSVGWERTSGIARSWNYMADQKCFASLEDEASIIEKEGK